MSTIRFDLSPRITLAFVVGVAVAVISCWSASRLAEAVLAAERTQAKRVPIGYAPEPDGTTLGVTSPETDGAGFVTTVTNRGTRTITSLTWVAIIEQQDNHERAVTIVTSEPFVHTIAPGQSRELRAEWLTAAHLNKVMAQLGSNQLQMFLAPSQIKYADGTIWSLQLDRSARTHMGAMLAENGKPKVIDIPRAMLNAPARPAIDGQLFCYDDRNAPFSVGAIVDVRNEPGRTTRCEAGRWVERP